MPMTAVSGAVQAGMRLQQNVAEMVIRQTPSPTALQQARRAARVGEFDEDDEPTDVNIPRRPALRGARRSSPPRPSPPRSRLP